MYLTYDILSFKSKTKKSVWAHLLNPTNNYSDSEDDEKGRKGHKKYSFDPETVDALGEFSFLKDEKTGVSKKRPDGSGEWSINQRAIDQMKEKFR